MLRRAALILIACVVCVPAGAKPKPIPDPGAPMILTFDEAWTNLGLGYSSNGESSITGSDGYISAPVALKMEAFGIDYGVDHYDESRYGCEAKFDLTGEGLPGIAATNSKIVRFWVNADDAYEDTPLRILIAADVGGGANYTLDLNKSDVVGTGWVYYEAVLNSVASFIGGSAVRFQLYNVDGTEAIVRGTWLVDDFEIAEVNMSQAKWDAVSAALEVIRGINGSSGAYHTQLDLRCYSRLFTPAEQPNMVLPYVCVPLDQEGERIEYEGFAFTSNWKLVGHAFFSDNYESDVLNSNGSEQAANFRDDIVRAFMEDQTLGGTTQNCELVAIDTSSGVLDDGVSEVVFTLEFTQQGGRSDLEAS